MKKVEAYQCKYCTLISLQEDEVTRHQPDCTCTPKTRGCCNCLWKSHWLNSSDGPCILIEVIKKDQNGSNKSNSNCNKWLPCSDLDGKDIYDVIDIIPESYTTRDEYCKILKKLIAKHEIVNLDIQEYMNYIKAE